MLFSLNDMTGFTAAAEDFEGSVIDVYLERDTWRISHLLLDIGGFMENHVVAVPGSVIAGVSPGDRTVNLSLTKARAEAARPLSDVSIAEGANISALPDLLFGADADAVARQFFLTEGSAERHVALSAAAASRATHNGEEIGQVISFIADAETLVASHITVDTGVDVPKSQHVLPVALVERVGDASSGTVLSVDKDRLAASPGLEEFDGLDRHWIDRVASYYGLT
ncbi:MAG: hypothetical protein AAFP87_07200 [Pseudomonadota bacterium]